MRTSVSFRLLFLGEVISWLLLQIPLSFSPPPLFLLQLSLPILQTSRIVNNLLIHRVMKHLENEEEYISFGGKLCASGPGVQSIGSEANDTLAIGQWLSICSQNFYKENHMM